MTTIKVAKAFSLLLSPTEKPTPFAVGEHEVEDHVAAHWYVQQHLEGYAPNTPADEPETLVITSIDATSATRDEMIGYLRGQYDRHLLASSDEELRESVGFVLDRFDDTHPAAPEDAVKDEDPGSVQETLGGGEGDDTLGGEASEAGHGDDSLSGDAGNDTIIGSGTEAGLGGDDTLGGEAGEDSLPTEAGADSVDGGAGDDAIEDPKKAAGRGKAKA